MSGRSKLSVVVASVGAIAAVAVSLSQVWSPNTPNADSSADSNDVSPPDGIYLVHASEPISDGHRVQSLAFMPDSGESEVNSGSPPVSIRLDDYVPLVIEGKPNIQRGQNGLSQLSVSLRRNYARDLERFTTDNLHRKVAIVIEGAVVTVHKVREPIIGGRVQISRCFDNQCELLYSALTE